ncbi:MAG: DUF3307 domain-containing protein [Chitinophagaceae bacterium]|nr:DUF3307 domain-containing protein [Chitinophagaceae bacterium]
MAVPTIWLIKLLLSHLLTDFVLQLTGWVLQRKERHFSSPYLYLHGLITAVLAWVFIGWKYWGVALIILISHILIDAWKSYQKEKVSYFLIDQLLHLAVITGCWYFTFINWETTKTAWLQFNGNSHIWVIITAFVFVTTPAGILIGQLTKKWQEKVEDKDNSLANAGKWIGIAERIIVLVLMLLSQYSAIGLLVAAKGILRFNEKDRPEIKTEYLVIGTLLSIGIAIVTGLITKM